MQPELKQYLSAALGAFILELAYWWQLRQQLDREKYRAIFKSRAYWAICALMVLLSPLACLIWFYDESPPSLRTYLLLGAAFPQFLKHAVNVVIGKERILGEESLTATKILVSYFRMA